jgi:uroporphyrinogen decarboxylase
VLGGLHQWRTLADGTPEQARAETRDAIAQTGGIGLIVGPGCVVPPAASPANLAAVVTTVGGR